jgi:hypothetical protein
MGLAVSTGVLADLLANDSEGAGWMRKQVAVVNAILAAEGLPLHEEPVVSGGTRARRHIASFPYSFLHYLRRAFARVREGLSLEPVKPDEDPAEDAAIEDVASMMDSHLVCHSDAEGFYVPLEFREVIFDTETRGLPGGMLGSSVRLLAELVEVAPALGIAMRDGRLGDDEAAKLADEDETSGPYWHERLVWLALYENARVSIANKSLLVFS